MAVTQKDREAIREIAKKYREIAEDDEWEIGIREVSPWCICKPAPKPETPMLPGLEIVKDR